MFGIDMNGLDAPSKDDKDMPKEKRQKLRQWDLVPAQALSSMGESGIEQCSLKELWTMVSTGNKAAAFFSEFADSDSTRRGIAISRLSQTIQVSVARLREPTCKKVLTPDLLKRALEEADRLEPHLGMLNGGNNVSTQMVGLKKRALAVCKSPEDVSKAANVLYDWLMQDVSPLRSLIAFMSGAGGWYVAQCHEKTARAYLQKSADTTVSKKSFAEDAVSRLCTTRPEESDEMKGISK
jgi:hypothetical protein